MATKIFIEENGNRIIVPIDASLSDFPNCTYEEGSEDTVGLSVLFRNARDNLLTTVVDPIVTNPLRWDVLTAEKRSEWATYRQELLDVPQQAGFPDTVTWPTEPE